MPNFSGENKFYLREDLKTQKNKKKKMKKRLGVLLQQTSVFIVHFNLYQLYRCQELGAMFLSLMCQLYSDLKIFTMSTRLSTSTSLVFRASQFLRTINLSCCQPVDISIKSRELGLKNRIRDQCRTRGLIQRSLIGHFRVPKTLTFKMRLGAQPFL